MNTPISRGDASLFPATRWSLIFEVKQASDDAAVRALGDLCQSYWYPLYVCARRSGLSPADSEDCVQGFLARLLANGAFDTVGQEKGRLRSFFRVSIKNFITEQWHKGQCQKRGLGALHLSIDRDFAEGQFAGESASDVDPNAEFDRSWAQSLINKVFAQLEEHYTRTGGTEMYLAIKGCLVGGGQYGSVDGIAEKLGVSSESVRSAVFRLRRRFRELIEAEVRDTCSSEDEVRDEIRYLCRILAT